MLHSWWRKSSCFVWDFLHEKYSSILYVALICLSPRDHATMRMGVGVGLGLGNFWNLIAFGFSFWPRDHETTRLGVGLGIFDKRIYLGWVGLGWRVGWVGAKHGKWNSFTTRPRDHETGGGAGYVLKFFNCLWFLFLTTRPRDHATGGGFGDFWQNNLFGLCWRVGGWVELGLSMANGILSPRDHATMRLGVGLENFWNFLIAFGFSFWPRDRETTRLGVGLGIFDKRIYLGWG